VAHLLAARGLVGDLSWARPVCTHRGRHRAREFPTDKLSPTDKLNVEFDAGDLARVIYIDHYGNAWTGVRGVPQDAESVPQASCSSTVKALALSARGRVLVQ